MNSIGESNLTSLTLNFLIHKIGKILSLPILYACEMQMKTLCEEEKNYDNSTFCLYF